MEALKMFRRTMMSLAVAVGSVALTDTSAFAYQPKQPDMPEPPVATSSPVTQPAPKTEALQATVTGVEGVVQVRTAEDQPWQKAKVGMVLDQNAEFRTGPRSAVRFTIPPDQTITLDRLGTVKLLQAVNDNGKIKTNLGMRYGRTRYDIEAAGREHESTISSPSSTLAVRGTKVSLYDQRPFASEAVSLTGRAEFRDARKRIRFGGPGAGKLKVNENAASAAAASLQQSYVDPGSSLARSESESNLIATLLSRGATLSYDYQKGIKVITGGTHPVTDAELIPVLPGSLNFVLRWDGNADLNLAVQSPSLAGANSRESVYPIAGLNVSPNGGRTEFDHRGGPKGGMEIVFWPPGSTPPDGSYVAGAVHISGAPTTGTLDVFQGANRLDLTTDQGRVQTVNFTSEPIVPGTGNEGQALGIARVFAPDPQAATAQSVKKKAQPTTARPARPTVRKR
jgi:hypothetical protein